MDAKTKRTIEELRSKPVLVGNYCRNAKTLSEIPIGTPCRRLSYSYEPLRQILKVRRLSWRKLCMITGLTTNSAVNLSKDYPVSMDIIAVVCYYLSLTPNEVVEFIYTDSVIGREDAAKASKRLTSTIKMANVRKAKQDAGDAKPTKPEEKEELYAGGLHTPLHALNASALISEQERQKQASRKMPPTLFGEDKNPPSTASTGSEGGDKKNAGEDDRPSILFGD